MQLDACVYPSCVVSGAFPDTHVEADVMHAKYVNVSINFYSNCVGRFFVRVSILMRQTLQVSGERNVWHHYIACVRRTVIVQMHHVLMGAHYNLSDR